MCGFVGAGGGACKCESGVRGNWLTSVAGLGSMADHSTEAGPDQTGGVGEAHTRASGCVDNTGV